MSRIINAVLVPQGAEYQAVYRGIHQAIKSPVQVFPMPMGKIGFKQHLQHLLETGELHPERTPNVLLMGLCGSLVSTCAVGDVVIYTDSVSISSDAFPVQYACCSKLVKRLQSCLGTSAMLVKGWTSDRVVHLAAEKQQLKQQYGADVVDMEGIAALECLQAAGIAVGIVRVVSDDCQHDIPDLSTAIGENGRMRSLPIAVALMRQPFAGLRLIRGSLKGLRMLEFVATQLVN